MRVERCDFIARIEVNGRIFLRDDIHRTAERRAAKTIGNNALVNLDALNHIGRNVVQRQIVAQLPDGRLVDIESHPFSLKSAHRNSRCTAHATRVSHGDASCACKCVVDTRRRSFQLPRS